MELTGTITAALPPKSGVSARTGNSWMTREYVIEIPGQYVKHVAFTIFGEDRIKQFNIKQYETVTIQFDIDAHEYNGKWFNEVRCYNVLNPNQQPAAAPQSAQQPAQQSSPQPAPQSSQQLPPPAVSPQAQGNDDLPF